jgi:Spy/CpxP family protein refolding chaperone
MNDYVRLNVSILCFGMSVLIATMSSAQQKSAQQPPTQQQSTKLQEIAQYLSLTPQQKDKILPILADEAPKVRQIKSDPSLSRMQRTQRIKAIHQQNDPQMKTILSPEQYQKLQAMRHKSISDAYH